MSRARVALRLGTAVLTIVVVPGTLERAATGVAAAFDVTSPTAPTVRLTGVYFDETPIAITVSAGWLRIPVEVSMWRLRSDRTLWLKMRFEDWNVVPVGLREETLEEMFRRYAPVLTGPAVWEEMTAYDWDLVPPPVRAIAFLRMIDHRVATAARGGVHQIPERSLSDTIAAIVMVESWFEHRAVNVNPGGDRDIGLAQASAFCRARLTQLHDQGAIDFRIEEEDYFNPWEASRIATVWFLRMLDEADGDAGLAIRAYHRGIAAARRGDGQEYLAQVEAKRRLFIRNADAPPSWHLVFARVRFPKVAPASGQVERRSTAAGYRGDAAATIAMGADSRQAGDASRLVVGKHAR